MIDDEIRNTDIEFFNTVYQRLMVRMERGERYYKEVPSQPV